jgi:signal transduction histidine kinase
MMSHELRTPLTAMLLHMRLLANPSSRAQHDDILVRHRRGLERLQQLIDSVFAYARPQGERGVAEVDLALLCAGVATELAPMAEDKGLNLRVDAPADLPRLWSDERLVRLLLVNLLTHAIAATDSGFVEIRVRFDAGEHRLEVVDTCPGYTPAEQLEIFEPLDRMTDLRTSSGNGSGLGLAIVKEMVQAVDGRISLVSSRGGGAAVTVVLPQLKTSCS